MVANPAASLRCAGIVLLVFGILGGIISPTGPLWVFIVGCTLVCCAEPGDEGLRKQASCARCVSITGIVFSAIFLIAFIVGGAWLLTAQDSFCNAIDEFYGQGCYRRLEQIDTFFHHQHGVHPNVIPYIPSGACCFLVEGATWSNAQRRALLIGVGMACAILFATGQRAIMMGDLLLCACANIGVTVDGKLVVGRRLHHRAGVHRRRPQGQGSPLWPQWAAAWPPVYAPVPHSGSVECGTSAPSDLFQPYVTQMYK